MESIENLTLSELTQKYFDIKKKISEAIEANNVIIKQIDDERQEKAKIIDELQNEQFKIYDLIKMKS